MAAPQTAPQTLATASTAPAASLAAAISNSASNAGQPVITVQGKIGEAILRPVNAPLPPAAPAATVSPDDVVATLEKLHGLVAKGILTQAEFDAKKAELLSKLS